MKEDSLAMEYVVSNATYISGLDIDTKSLNPHVLYPIARFASHYRYEVTHTILPKALDSALFAEAMASVRLLMPYPTRDWKNAPDAATLYIVCVLLMSVYQKHQAMQMRDLMGRDLDEPNCYYP